MKMATTKKTKKRPTKKKAAPRKKATAKRSAPKWRCDKHPVTKKPCKGRVMSKRDQKLFTVAGKRRKGVGIVKIREAYGLRKPAVKKKKAAPKRKPAAKKRAAPKRKPAARKKKAAPKRKPAAKKSTGGRKVTIPANKLTPAQAKKRYFILDVNGKVVYATMKKSNLVAKFAALTKQHPRRKFSAVKKGA
jgi:hypothetical protein